MKKITLFALAALTASSAFAAFPQVEAVKSQAIQSKLHSPAAKSAVKMQEKRSISRAEGSDQSEEIIPELPTYMTFDALYMGMSAQFKAYSVPMGFVPASGEVTFSPFYQADSYSWEWVKYLSGGLTEDKSSEDVVLSVPVSPIDQFSGPTLKMTAGNTIISYNDSVDTYFAGGYPALYLKEDPEDRISLTPVKETTDLFRASSTTINYMGVDGWNKVTGTSDDFFDCIYSDYSRFDEVDSVYVTDYTDFKINGYGSVVPGSFAPFQLTGGYFFIYAQTKAVAEVKIAVFGFDEKGYVNFADTLGVGSMILPEGQTAGAVDFTLSAVDPILGLSTDQPIIVPTKGVYLSFYGVNDPDNITYFSPFYNSSNKIDYLDRTESGALNPIYNYTNPRHAFVEFTCKSPEGEDISDYSPNFGLYGSDIHALSRAFEYLIYYDVEYPFIICATEGFSRGDMTIEIPVEGGSTNRYYEASQDIMQLIDDEYVTVEESGDTDWYVFDTEPDDEYATVFNFLVEAEPLPEGVEGRKATVTFKGYGFDSTITIVQGTPASINEVVATKAKNGKVYDLQGRAVKNATKGIYIVDGKKVIL